MRVSTRACPFLNARFRPSKHPPQKTVSHLFSHPLSQLCSECSGEIRLDIRLEGGGVVAQEVPEVSRRNFPPKSDRATRGCSIFKTCVFAHLSAWNWLSNRPRKSLLCPLPRKILWIFFACLAGNFALKNGRDFWWIFSGLRLPRNEARKLLENFGENSEQNSEQNSGRKIEKFGELSFCNFSSMGNRNQGTAFGIFFLSLTPAGLGGGAAAALSDRLQATMQEVVRHKDRSALLLGDAPKNHYAQWYCRMAQFLGSPEGGHPDLFRFPRFLPICPDLRSFFSGMPRFVPISADLFSEQIGTNQGIPPSADPFGNSPNIAGWPRNPTGTRNSNRRNRSLTLPKIDDRQIIII